MITPHRHAEFIHAWADGAKIEKRRKGSTSYWTESPEPVWSSKFDYRVKPKPVPNVVTWHSVNSNDIGTDWPLKSDATYAMSTAILRLEINHNDPANPVLVSATLEQP